MASTDLITLTEARDHLRVSDGDVARNDALSSMWIPAVTPIVEDIVGPVVARTVTYRTPGATACAVLLPSRPTAITSVTDAGIALTVSDLTFDSVAGVLHTQSRFTGDLVVTYTAGIAADTGAVPPTIKLAACIILASIYRVDQNAGRPAFGSPSEGNAQQGALGYEIPKRAYALLRPFAAGLLPGLG